MCTSPIHIKAKSTYFDKVCRLHGYHVSGEPSLRAYDVPCGKCPQCLQQKRDDIFLRVSHEWSLSKCHGLFLTLTYNQKHLPTVKNETSSPVWLEDEECPWYVPELVAPPTYSVTSTWYKPHVQKYLKSLNEKLIYYIGTEIKGLTRLATIDGHRKITPEWKHFLSTCARPLKYLVVCERGKGDIYIDDSGHTRQGTERPHYHCILLINNSDLFTHIPKVLELSKTLWTYGNSYNVQIKKPSGEYSRSPVACIEYVCKYVTKDITDISSSLVYKDHCDKLNRKPFILMSKFLGFSLLDNYTDITTTIDKGITVPCSNGVRSVNVPRYNVTRLSKSTITGQVSETNLKPRLNRDVYYDPSYPTPLTFLDDEQLYSVASLKPYLHTKTILTKTGKDIQFENINRKASYYASELMKFQTIKPSTSLWKSFNTPLSKRNYYEDVELLHSFTSDDLYCFIMNDLYYHKDNSEYPDSLYQLYLLVRDINSTLSILKNRKRELDYKNNLAKSVEHKPELFNINAL